MEAIIKTFLALSKHHPRAYIVCVEECFLNIKKIWFALRILVNFEKTAFQCFVRRTKSSYVLFGSLKTYDLKFVCLIYFSLSLSEIIMNLKPA